jgi:uncharacterized protein YcgL (UPF0745 family)
MKVWVYKSERKSSYYLYVATEDDFSNVPDALLKGLGKLDLALEFILHADRKLASENTETVLSNLNNQGYHLQINEPMLYGTVPNYKL